MTIIERGNYESVLVSLRRVTRVMKGGKRFRFSALVVVGDGNGKVGAALGKAPEAMLAIKKAEEKARKNMFSVPIVNQTIPHEVIGENTTSRVLLKPAGPGTGIIASMPVRSVLEKSGYKNVLTKSLGSNNHINLVWATIDALKKLKTKEQQLEILQSSESKDEFEKYLQTQEQKSQTEKKISKDKMNIQKPDNQKIEKLEKGEKIEKREKSFEQKSKENYKQSPKFKKNFHNQQKPQK